MKLADARNLGPKSAAMLAELDVHTLEDVQALGAAEVFVRAKVVAPKTSLNLLWALEGALRGIDWRELPPEVKRALRREVADVL